jgi:hypothetical protein
LEAQELIPHLREVFLGKSKKMPKVIFEEESVPIPRPGGNPLKIV